MARRGARKRSVLWLAALIVLTVGCVRGCPSSRPPIHIVPNMDFQPKYESQEASDFFYDGATMRTPVEGTVARSTLPFELQVSVEYNTGKDPDGNLIAAIPVDVDEALVERGEERFGIYCAACHDSRGTGKGILFEYGSVPTTSMYDPKVTDVVDGHIFDVITNGIGLMEGYAYPIPVNDRWAIVAYVRELQARQAQ
jgi:mono/diheme cytochrome c family protein